MKDDEYFEGTFTEALQKALGPDGFLLLVERYGGVRIFVPSTDRLYHGEVSGIVRELGEESAAKLKSQFGGMYVRIPLARSYRALVYLRKGYSVRSVARLLGMAEPSIDVMIARFKKKGDLPVGPRKRVIFHADTRQRKSVPASNFGTEMLVDIADDKQVDDFLRCNIMTMDIDRLVELCVHNFGAARTPGIAAISVLRNAVMLAEGLAEEPGHEVGAADAE